MVVYLLIAWALERIVYVLFYRPRGPVSVRQTTIAEYTPQQTSVETRQTTETDVRIPSRQGPFDRELSTHLRFRHATYKHPECYLILKGEKWS